MPVDARRPERRDGTLTRERITAAAVEILDAGGERALTFRALAQRLHTGSGALHWHVADKDDLLAAATDAVFERAVGTRVPPEGRTPVEPVETLRAIALATFDTLMAHPWAGAHLHHRPWSALLRVFEGIGSAVAALGVPDDGLFDAASALVNYVLGVAGLNAAQARLAERGIDRTAFLATVADEWTGRGADRDTGRHPADHPADHPFVHRVAQRLREHDEREQFLAGVDLFIAGIATMVPRA